MKKTRSLLLVEDEPLLRRMMVEGLQRHDYCIVQAETGRQALDLIRRRQIDAAVIDSALLDMNGQDVADQLAETHPNLAVIVISGYPRKCLLEKGVLRSATPFMKKPFRCASLHHNIERLLARPSMTFTAAAS